MKKKFSIIVALFMLVSNVLVEPVFATENNDSALPTLPQISFEYFLPSDGNTTLNRQFIPIQPYGLSKPTTKWDIGVNGEYLISGSSTVADPLYTEYYFIGASTYSVHLENKRSDALTFEVILVDGGFLWFDSVFFTYTIPAGYALGFTISDISSSDKWYIKFSGPVKVTGKIS